MNVFLDSSFIVALSYKEDTNHLLAQKLLRKYQGSSYYINDLVKYESVNVAIRKGELKLAKYLNSWFSRPAFNTISLNQKIWESAFKNIISRHTKSGPNIFDHIHFACMSEYCLTNVLTFDSHFSRFGFTVLQ
ncbi:MAG: type II toxin-antitoxin system VapC family toxin [Candidatus Shapirobacteria bacterium]|jgi:predicted nucleic acid-binding protein